MEKILIIDDDQDIGRMIKLLLEYKGYAVTVLEKPEKAPDVLRNNSIDLIIMDMLLSGTNGTDICADFKNDAAFTHIPVIMMSAHPDAQKKCLEAGAEGFISKPFDLQDLLSEVQRLIKIPEISEKNKK